MSAATPAHSVLYPWIERYLALRQALGRQGQSEDYVYRALDRFLVARGSDLDADSFEQWCQQQRHLKSGVRRQRMRLVRNLCLYRRRSEPGCFVPDRALFPAPHQPVRPHLFGEAEIVRLVHAAATLQSAVGSRLRTEVFQLAILLLYTTGLRRGELLRLTIADYDRTTQTLLVRASKFHKARYLPLSTSMARALEDHLACRRRHHLPVTAETALIGHHDGRHYSGGGFGQTMRGLFRQAAIRTPEGNLPRVHDMRHAFAVNALRRWYHQGADVQVKLPWLATYMGHVSIVSTAYYLPLVEPLAGAAAARFAAGCAALVTPAPGGAP